MPTEIANLNLRYWTYCVIMRSDTSHYYGFKISLGSITIHAFTILHADTGHEGLRHAGQEVGSI